jgi:complement component 1 Q subcomponent-binding protein
MNMSQLSRSSLLVRYAARSCVRSTNGSLSFAGAQMSALAHPYPGSQQSASMPSIRYFSDEAGQKQELSDILAREHAEEVENNSAEIPSELEELKNQLAKDWKIVDDGALTKMFRTQGAIKVQVNFHCQDAVEVEEEYDEEGNVVEAEDEAANPVNFTVIATKAGKSLVFTCISQDATACIQNVAMTTEDADSILALTNSVVDSSQYQGPDFDELAEDLQDAFHGYLTYDVGMNEDVASFIAMYSDHKEQAKYVEFLKDAQALLD